MHPTLSIDKLKAAKSNLVDGKKPGMQSNGHASPHLSTPRTLGNQGVMDMVQSKLKIGEPNDRYEQEADHVAERVMGMQPPTPPSDQSKPDTAHNGPVVQRKCTQCGLEEKAKIQRKPINGHASMGSPPATAKPWVQRKCAACQEEEGRIQLKPLPANSKSDHSESVSVNAAIKQGQALSRSEQQFFGPRFGVDFSHVRIHNSVDASRSATDLGARAYTFGHHIVFNRGEYHSGSPSTRPLLAHELTHVIQQSGQGNSSLIQRTTTRGAGGCGPPRDIDEDLDGARAAGRTAHTQLQSFLLTSAIANELEIPRATKRHMTSTGCQPDSRHEGRADLWKPGGVIGIAEIKPFGFATSTGRAREEAEHYILRSRQSVDRTLSSGGGPNRCGHEPAGADDTAFARRIGMTGGIGGRKRFTKLRGILPSATTIGSFDGDRSRTLKAKLTEPGSVGYWCTGGRSTSYPCDASGRETEEYIDSILSNAQDALDDFIRDRFEGPIDELLDSFDMRELLRIGKRHFWPQLREAIRRELGPAGSLIPEDISTDELADIIDAQLGPMARSVVQTILRRFKSIVLNELRRMLRDMLRNLIREALVALCVGVPVVTLATLLDKLKELFKQQSRLLIPVAVNLALARIATAIMRAIAEALAEIGNFVLRILAGIALIIVVLAAIILAIVTIAAALDPVPGDEVATGAGTLALAELATALFLFVVSGEMPEEESGGGT